MRATRKSLLLLTWIVTCAGWVGAAQAQTRPMPRRPAALPRTSGQLMPSAQVNALSAARKRTYTDLFTVPLPPPLEVQIWNGLGSRGSEFFGFSQISLQQDWARSDVKWWYRVTCRDARATRAVWQASRFDFPETAEGWQRPPGLVAQGEVQPLAASGQWSLFQVDYTPFAPSPEGPRTTPAPATRAPATPAAARVAPGAPSRSATAAGRPTGGAGARADLARVGLDRRQVGVLMRSLPLPATFYVRVVALDAQGAVVGRPSESIALTFAPPPPSNVTFTREGFGHPTARFSGYRALRPDAADSLCIYRSVRDWVDPLTKTVVWPAGTYFDTCQPKDSSFLDDLGDVVGGFFGAMADLVTWVSRAYESAKGVLVNAVVSALKSTVGCGGTCQSLVTGALDAGLCAVGLPPTLPNFDEMVDLGADYLAAKIAAEAGVPEGAAKEAMGAFVDEVRKSRQSAPAETWLVPDPDRQYRPAHLLVEVTNRGTVDSHPVVMHLKPRDGAFFKESEVPLPPMAAGQTLSVPVFLQPADDPGGWRNQLPTAQDAANIGLYLQKHQAALAARAAWEQKYAGAAATFEVYTLDPMGGTNFPQFVVTVTGGGSAAVQ